MKIGQFVDVAVTAVNPDGTQAAVPAMLTITADSGAVTASLIGEASVKVSGAAAGPATVTFSAPGFKPCQVQFVITDLPQLVATLGPEQP